MPFEFSLAAVLRYRASIEQREHLALEKLQQALSVTELKIREVDHACSLASQKRIPEAGVGIIAADVQSAYSHLTALEQQRDALRTLLEELKLKWQQQLRSYELAHRKRETLEHLRSQQLDAYKREQARREQSVIDDVFLSRRGRS